MSRAFSPQGRRRGDDRDEGRRRTTRTAECSRARTYHNIISSSRNHSVARYRLDRVPAPFAFAPRGYYHGARPRSRLCTPCLCLSACARVTCSLWECAIACHREVSHGRACAEAHRALAPLLIFIQLAIRGLHPRAASAVVSLTPFRMPLVLLKHGKLPDHPERADWPAGRATKSATRCLRLSATWVAKTAPTHLSRARCSVPRSTQTLAHGKPMTTRNS